MAKDDLLPKKKTSSTAKASARQGASPSMARLMRITRGIGVLAGGFVTLIGMMSVLGFITESFWVRFAASLLVVVGVPAFVSDRLLKRTNLGGGLAMVFDVFAIVLLGVALVLVAADLLSKPLLVREGDRYAKSGSRTMARVVYFLGGVTPKFPDEKGTAPSGSGSAAPSASGAPKASAAR